MINNLKKLNMGKNRGKKIAITEVAISKVPYVKYYGFDDNRNKIMQQLARDVLQLAKDENNSNEVAITCDLESENPLEDFGVALGDEHEVDILADTYSNHIIVSQESVAVVVLHNHPESQTFSLQDIQFFIEYPMIEVIVVVSNQGTVHYLMREEQYDYKKAFELFKDCIDGLNKESTIKELYLASLSFLAKCSEAGLYYR